MVQIFTPHSYQKKIIDYIIKYPRCNIWAGMGMGKTVSVLTAIKKLFTNGIEKKPALVIAPLRVANSIWSDETKKWKHLNNLKIQPIIGNLNQRLQAIKNDNAHVFTINYENIPWLYKILKSWIFSIIVADESTKLKSFRLNKGSKRATILAKIAHNTNRWINLTGTPAPNGLVDLWGQSWFIDRGHKLGKTFSLFEKRWFETIKSSKPPWKKLIPYKDSQKQIYKALKNFTLYLDPVDYFDITKPIHYRIKVVLPPKVRKQYDNMEREMFFKIKDINITAFNAAVCTMKCLQLASGAVYLDNSYIWKTIHNEKIEALKSIINESGNTPLLVAYHWKHDLYRLLKFFPKGKALDNNPKTIDNWNSGKIPILFSHPASSGHGLNLHNGSNILVFFSHWWNLEQYQQIIERIGPVRQAQAGFKRQVLIYHIIAKNTVDELIMERRKSKRQIQDILLSEMKKPFYT